MCTSCMNDFDTEAVATDKFTATNVGDVTTTISALRAKYASVISNSSYQQITTNEVIEGIVVANDISGNIYQFIYLQEVSATGGNDTQQGGIAVGIKNIGCLYTIFPVGQRVKVNLKGLYIGGYGECPRIGQPYINTNGAMRMGPMPSTYLATNIEKVGTPQPQLVVPRELKASDFTPENITKLTPMLVKLSNATIADVGWPYAHWEPGGDIYSEYHDIAIGGKTVRQLLYTSTSATFAGDTIKSGKKDIYGLLNRYSSSYQLSLRSIEDIVELEK